MSSLSIARFAPRLPLSLTRVAQALLERVEALRERRRQRLVFEALQALDPQTRRDLGLADADATRARMQDARIAVGADHW